MRFLCASADEFLPRDSANPAESFILLVGRRAVNAGSPRVVSQECVAGEILRAAGGLAAKDGPKRSVHHRLESGRLSGRPRYLQVAERANDGSIPKMRC